MSRARVSPLLVGGVLLLILLGWGLYASIEFYDETEESGWSVSALRNPYLAAQQFMERSDIGVTDVDSLLKLEQLDGLGTLFFSDANQVRTPQQLRQVLDWLEGGGNVIYSASASEHDDDMLLREFAVEVVLRDREEDEDLDGKPLSESLRDYNRQIESGKTRAQITQQIDEQAQPLTSIRFAGDVGDLEVAFDTARILQQPYIDDDNADTAWQPFSWSSSIHGVHMLQFEVGDGLLTILSDPGIWTSYRIDAYDHAYLLWLLSSQEGNFAILRAVLRDSIWVLMLRHASELLLIGGLFIAVLLWRLGTRFGRLLPRDLSRRRALGEHFSSVSHYLWQRQRSHYLLLPLRQAALRRASQALNEFGRAEPTRQYQLIAERCELNSNAVAHAFTRSDFNELSFVKTVRLLKLIEQSL
jgi:hypothetical protein